MSIRDSSLIAAEMKAKREAAEKKERQRHESAEMLAAANRQPGDEPLPKRIKQGPVVLQMSGVAPERLEWVWQGRIPAGKLTLIDGDPGLGKSTMVLDLMSRLTRGGTLPDGSDVVRVGTVIGLSAEDGLADTVRPRFEAAGADLTKAYAFTGIADHEGLERPPAFPDDTGWLEEIVVKHQAVAVAIDPLMAFLGSGVDAHKDQDVRRALASLAGMADRTGAAVIMVRHLNKAAGRQALYRGGGSIGIAGAARSVLLVAQDPDDPEARVLCRVKGNLSREPAALRFKLVTAGDSSRVEWLGESNHSADSLVAPPESEEVSGAIGEAVDFLVTVLKAGSVESREILNQARGAGHAERTLNRAKLKLRVVTERRGFGPTGKWYWSLPAGIDGQALPHTEGWQPMGDLAAYGADRVTAPIGGPIDCQPGHRLPPANGQGDVATYGDDEVEL